ncbi:hypothetical protein [Frigidibacter mobilis]|nr:hypothetical protein [Frigidibacter mobilis]
MTPEERAALDAYEKGQGDTPNPATHPKLAELRAALDALPDVRRLNGLLDAAMNDASDPVPVTIAVQPGLLRLLAHIAGLDATAAGRAPDPVSASLAQRVHNDLENLLHQLATDPTNHPHYAKAWNALCAAEGAPELAVPDGTPQSGPQAGERGVF